jgi:hypothetical protein
MVTDTYNRDDYDQQRLTVGARLARHEAVCETRQGEIIRRLGRLEAIMVTSAGAIIVAAAVIVGKALHLT